MTRPTWVALHGMAHSFIELDKAVVHVISLIQFSSVAQLCLTLCVQLLATPWATACQASLSITSSWSLLKFMSIELVMPSNHLILCPAPSPPTFNLSQHQGLFQ